MTTSCPNRTSPLVVLALAAAVVVGSGAGGAVAGSLVTSKQIKNNTILGKDVRNGTLTGADVADGSLGTADVADGSLGTAEVADGSLTSADLAPGARTELRGLLASGRTTDVGGLAFTRTAPGVTVTNTRIGNGVYCLRLLGVSADSTNTGITLTGYYPQGGSSAGTPGAGAIIEPLGPGTGCTDGFRVYTLTQSGNSVFEDDQPFYFQIG